MKSFQKYVLCYYVNKALLMSVISMVKYLQK